jgi:hypothetical protein
LDDAGTVQTKRAGDVALKASHTNAHVLGVAQLLQRWSQNTDHGSDRDDPPPGRKKFSDTIQHSEISFY